MPIDDQEDILTSLETSDRLLVQIRQLRQSSAATPRRHLETDESFIPLKKEWARTSLGEAFASVARLHADRVALSLRDIELTYRDLHSLSDQVADFVADQRRADSGPIAIMMQTESVIPAVIMGATAAGKIVVPLDPAYPVARSRQIMDDTGATLMICDPESIEQASRVVDAACRLVTLDEVRTSSSPSNSVSPHPDDPAIVIYTSGSSGAPKGVIRTHYGLLHNAMRHTNERQVTPRDRVAQLFSLSFGAGLSNTFTTLLTGATLMPFDLRARGTTELIEWLGKKEATLFHTVPTAFRRFAAGLNGARLELPHLRLVLLGGERMFRQDLDLFKECFPHHCAFGLGMGTSETGHVLHCFFDTRSQYDAEILPAGFPSDDCIVQICDEEGREVPRGEPGEIVIKGDFVSLEYWGQSGARGTATPTAAGGGQSSYHTGDLGCMLENGCTYHLGRTDSRVKVRGYRIDTAEVESALRDISGIREAVVLPVERDVEGTTLFACVATAVPTLTEKTVRNELRSRLPAYMMPSTLVVVDKLPTLPNGKLDFEEAVRLRSHTTDSLTKTEAPRFILEAQLRAIWERILNVAPISRLDDFYDLGGDSISAVRMFREVEDVCEAEIAPALFATGLTIERLCEEIVHARSDFFVKPIVQIQDGTDTPFFFHNGDSETGGLYCRNLARSMGEELPFYALMPHGIFNKSVPTSAVKMAADYVDGILQIQPKGPYRIGGFCFGGTVALEIARILSSRGHDVDVVIMIDSRVRSSPGHVGRVMTFLWRMLPAENVVPYRRLRRLLQLTRRILRVGRQESLEKALVAIRAKGAAGEPHPSTHPSHLASHGVLDDGAVFQLTNLALGQHSPPPYDGRVVLFYTSHVADKIEQITAAWKEVTPDLEIEAIDGDHRSSVTRHVTELAARMRKRL